MTPFTWLSCEPAQAARGEGRAIVDSDDLGATVLAEQTFKDAQRALELLVGPGVAADQVVAETVAHRERIAAHAVGGAEPSLEVDRPDVIGVRWLGQRGRRRRVESGGASLTLTEPMSPEDGGDRAPRRWHLDPIRAAQHLSEFLWSPTRMTAAFPQNQVLDFFGGMMRAPVRPSAVFVESGRPFGRITAQPLVSGFSAHVEILAQLRHRKAAGGRETAEL